MLTVIYKIASGTIANRIKTVLNSLISHKQNGFVPGRYIGESTRLIYDIMHFTELHNIPGLLILIDFEKAYDSISWKFLYKVLSFLGFTNNFISWIKLFNTDIKTAALQNGFLSDFIQIGRGCRQGDPISAYLFIMAAEVLTLLFLNNDRIRGIRIKNLEFKCTQFADDTTLILDGTSDSLESAFNTLEIFGSISGLKINTDKTKIVWIGKKKYSKEKLILKKFQWDETEFTLLGLKFSVDLSKMVQINYSAKMVEIKESIKHWNKRFLTPLGKVTVIKTFLLSKLNHIFLSLPNRDPTYLKELNEIFLNFIWSNKPDKISRRVLTLDFKKGGIKMIDLEKFVMSLKVTCLRRALKSNSPWVALFQSTIMTDMAKFQIAGSTFAIKQSQSITNNFWISVLHAQDILFQKYKPCNLEQTMSTPLWYNPKMSTENLYLPTWCKKGIRTFSDVIDSDGNFITAEELRKKYSFRNMQKRRDKTTYVL